MKFTVGNLVLLAVLLGGCQAPMTLELAQERCAAQGGMLTIIYTQSITPSGVGEQIGSPGDCISPSRFENTSSKPAPATSPAK